MTAANHVTNVIATTITKSISDAGETRVNTIWNGNTSAAFAVVPTAAWNSTIGRALPRNGSPNRQSSVGAAGNLHDKGISLAT